MMEDSESEDSDLGSSSEADAVVEESSGCLRQLGRVVNM